MLLKSFKQLSAILRHQKLVLGVRKVLLDVVLTKR